MDSADIEFGAFDDLKRKRDICVLLITTIVHRSHIINGDGATDADDVRRPLKKYDVLIRHNIVYAYYASGRDIFHNPRGQL